MDAAEVGVSSARISRAALLKRFGIVGAAAAVPTGVLAERAAAPPPEREQLVALTAEEADAVEAFVERLVPTDANGPGAREARVARYIDRALGGDLRELAPFYSTNLVALDSYSRATFGARFADLSPAQQDEVLTALERNQAPGFTPSSSAFFETVREHALQGMFGDPVHGGNADFVGWDLIGFPGIKLNFLPKEQQLDVTVRSAHKSTADFPQFGFKKHH